MHAGLLDLLHHAGDVDVGAVGDGVHVDLDGTIQELVDQHRIGSRDVRRLHHVAAQRVDILHELHRPSAKDIGGPQENGVADALGDGLGLLDRGRRSIGRLLQAEPAQQRLEALPVLGQVDDVGWRPEDRDAGLLQCGGELEGVWPPN